MADLTQFELGSAQRIARVVRQVEQEVRRARPLVFDRVETPRRQQVADVFKVCTFTGAWSKLSDKTVTFRNQTATPNTASATNLFAAISSSTATRNCAIARDGTAWYLVAAEC